MERLICPPDHPHGLNNTCRGAHGCKCDDCRDYGRQYEYWRQHQLAAGVELLVDATGTRRRIEALAAIGWSARLVAAQCGVANSTVTSWRRSTRVSRDTADRVRRVYDELSMRVPEPVGKVEKGAVTKARKWARDNGYPPPLAWDDEAIDDPAAEPVITVRTLADRALEAAENRAEVQRLTGYRLSIAQIADRTGLTTRQVTRLRGAA